MGLKILLNVFMQRSFDPNNRATMQIGRQFVKKKGRGKPLPSIFFSLILN
jgi:hypothetical protein